MLLDEILENKKEEIKHLSVGETRNRKLHHLSDYFNDNINIIAEIKGSSPSAGFLNKINLEEILDVYSKYAHAISVLTDKKFFSGSFERLSEVCGRVNMPVLCKDFIIDRVQIDKAYACGADIVLLIVRILDDERLNELCDYAEGLGLDVLVEVHSLSELERIKKIKPSIVGVNSRDLDTLEISLERAKNILDDIDFKTLKIAESGIKTQEDIDYLRTSCSGFLIGEALIKNLRGLENKFLSLI